MGRALASLALATGILALGSASARAQEVSAQDRRSAAEAYDRGTAAYLDENFARAAHWFETAHRLAPAAAALVQATRSHQRAGHARRAATLALRLQALYPDDQAAARTAEEVLEGARDRYFLVRVECGDCEVELDGALMGHPSFFLDPDSEHRVVAAYDTGNVSETVSGDAGESRTLTFEAPPPDPSLADAGEGADTGDDAPDAPDGTEPTIDGGGGGVPVWVSIGALVITAGLGATLIWSGIDTLDGVPAYEENPTPEALADGQGREERTNWLIAGTSVAGAATLLLLVFTDWGGGGDDSAEADAAEPEVQAVFDIQGQGFAAGLRGRF
ncbi:MAG TPA: hypothetical protein RMH99_33140 [Sandaracinaceae bacterium LLY-WYZ-13_1]|nr:hypothetical protein [Sandaracinaceae bacterium LLY-WYZ-13_1]